jgi:hypothetical protein
MADYRHRLAQRDVSSLLQPEETRPAEAGSPDPTEEFIEETEAGEEGEPTGKDEFTSLQVDEVDTGET